MGIVAFFGFKALKVVLAGLAVITATVAVGAALSANQV